MKRSWEWRMGRLVDRNSDDDLAFAADDLSTEDGALIAAAPELLALMRKASQLASVASDWNLYEVEIDAQMVGIYDLKGEFDAAIDKAEGR